MRQSDRQRYLAPSRRGNALRVTVQLEGGDKNGGGGGAYGRRAKAPHLNQASQRRGRRRGPARVDEHLVVGDERRAAEGTGLDRRERERGFARARSAEQEDARARSVGVDGKRDGGGVKERGLRCDSRRHPHAPGSSTTKRAPLRSPFSSMRFSAQMTPSWLMTICREIASPRPELLPKAEPCGRFV